MGALHREFVRRADKGQAGEPGDFGGGRLAETRRRVDAGAHRRAAQRQAVDALQRIFDPLDIVAEHARIARPFLAERDRRGVLHVRAADLDDVLPLLGLRRDRIVQSRHRRDEPLLHVRPPPRCSWRRGTNRWRTATC